MWISCNIRRDSSLLCLQKYRNCTPRRPIIDAGTVLYQTRNRQLSSIHQFCYYQRSWVSLLTLFTHKHIICGCKTSKHLFSIAVTDRCIRINGSLLYFQNSIVIVWTSFKFKMPFLRGAPNHHGPYPLYQSIKAGLLQPVLDFYFIWLLYT